MTKEIKDLNTVNENIASVQNDVNVTKSKSTKKADGSVADVTKNDTVAEKSKSTKKVDANVVGVASNDVVAEKSKSTKKVDANVVGVASNDVAAEKSKATKQADGSVVDVAVKKEKKTSGVGVAKKQGKKKAKKAPKPIIELQNVSKYYGDMPAAKNVTLKIKKGEFVTLLGPSGCGKTTTLRMIAGFETPSEGKVFIDGADVTNVPPHKRPVNTVFQRYALFPHLNVFKNIAFGLKLKRIPDGVIKDKKGNEYEKLRKLTKQEIKAKVENVLKLVDLEGYGHRDVSSLSGGQQQRVAIARALVNEPQVLLLDEPLGALDLKMRQDMQIELMDMHKKLGITFVYVTHDQEEALTMSDTIVVMRHGLIQQIAPPQVIYDEPANVFVADFIGESNIFSGVMLEDYKVEILGHEIECVDKGFKKNEPVDVVIRPEDIYIIPPDIEKSQAKAVVEKCVFKGDHFEIIAYINDLEIIIHETEKWDVGEEIGIFIKPTDMHIMQKSRLANEIITKMIDKNLVDICDEEIECISDLEAETDVKVTIAFDKVIVHDDEEDGKIGGQVVSSIYKGNYYQCIIRADNYYNFFVDTEDDWLKGDRVGLSFNKEDIKIEKIDPERAEKAQAIMEKKI